MKKFAAALAGAVFAMSFAGPALAKDKTIAVSWKTFQEERWKTDEAAIKAAVEAAGNKYISTDAQGSAQKQAADIEGLISQKPDVVHGRCLRLGRHPAVDQGAAAMLASSRLPMTCSSKIRTHSTSPSTTSASAASLPRKSRRRSRKATMPSSRATRATRTPLPVPGHDGSAQGRPRLPARSRTSAKPSPTAGSRTMPRRTWSSA